MKFGYIALMLESFLCFYLMAGRVRGSTLRQIYMKPSSFDGGGVGVLSGTMA